MSMIENILALLSVADVVSVDDGPLLTEWDLAEVVGLPDNEVVHFTWDDEYGSFAETLTEGGIAAGKFYPEDAKLVCENAEGEPTTIRFFTLDPLRQPGAGSKAAAKFVDELLQAHETFTGIAEVYGTRAVVDLLYLQQAILKGTYIDCHPDESSILDVVGSLQSAEQWKTFIQVVRE